MTNVYRNAIAREADLLRIGIRNGAIACDCRGRQLDEPHRCDWAVAVAKVYEYERELEAKGHPLSYGCC